MKRLAWMLVPTILLTAASPGAGQLFRRRPAAAANPVQRVPELIVALRTDQSDRQRAQAAEELQNFDATKFGEILPALAVAAEKDASVSVRLEAITSLGRLRPINPVAGAALEKVANHENHLRVRLHARATLFWYQRAGYSGQGKGTEVVQSGDTAEPPLLQRIPVSESIVVEAEIPQDTTVLPALKAPSVRTPTEPEAGNRPLPLPRGTPFSTAVPQQPLIITRPAPAVDPGDRVAPPPPVPAGKSDF